ncbi:MAG: DUF4091 domain-containing protein [Armatimonadetes bacterium]|nr:DUF4091 domain-containing protein [Armatimonadota bacterium]
MPWPSTYNPELVAEARRHGASIWAYENELYPLDVPDCGLLMRGFPWRLRRYDVEGVEWWAVSKWRTDPWIEPNQYELQNGGGCFLYPTPGRKGRPIDSVRWELYRQGVEDYDVLTLVRERATRRYEELVKQVALSPADVARDPRVMERVRRAACEVVEKGR